jgi:amino acid adenylation domain-containing protein
MNVDIDPSSLSSSELRALVAERLLKSVQPTKSAPLSPAQQRLWFLDQLQPDSPVYNIPSICRLRGALDLAALERSLNAIAQRHQTLRSRFLNADGEPILVIDPEPDLPLLVHDLSTLPEGEREQAGERLMRAEVKTPFKLSDGHLVRATILRFGPEDHVLILNIHHIVADEWSFKVLFNELGQLYHSFAEEKPVTLPELRVQYSDYARWQREWLESGDFHEQLDYWKTQLKGNPAPVELPADRVAPANSTAATGSVEIHHFGPALSQALAELARGERVTMFMLLLAAFKTLLFRYTHQEDLVVGSPMAGRNRVETEDLVGFFVNTLPLRTRVQGDMPFTELLTRVREVALGAYSHQDVPFDKIVEALQPDRSVHETPFVKVMFIYQSDIQGVELGKIQAEPIDIYTDTAKFDWTLWVAQAPDHLVSGIEYDTRRFDRATVTRFLQHLESLLQAIVARPNDRLCDFQLLTENERRELIAPWEPPAARSPHACIHSWFEAQAEKTPDAIALTCEKEQITYQELNERANQLAHLLRRHTVGPEIPVGLFLERSPEMLMAILAVLKAGGAYVPIDPTCPTERLEFMIQDTAAPVILTQTALQPRLPKTTAWVLTIDAGAEANEPVSNPSNSTRGENVAYIIYTSGSTGKPKGVLVTHENVVRLLSQTEGWYGFTSDDVWTLFHAYTFDFSVWEIWGALCYGGRLVIVPYLVSRSPAEFYSLLSRERVTVLNQTPSAFRQLIWAEETASAQLPLALRYVIFGGEALELQSLKPWFDRHGDQRPQLVNMYGITETTVHVTYRVIRERDLSAGLGSVIGVPIPDLRICLLDEKLQPVPIGVPGEICVAGAGVARGYLNRPELTAERFIPDPFTNSGAKLYRSGDLARYTSSGELEYLGRIDHQVKVRGFRVELGEIESSLNSHPSIRESTVIVMDSPGGGNMLVAYIVPVEAAPAATDVRQHLSSRLPEYMIPSVLIPLESLPLTSNGKVDRRALPPPDQNQTCTGEALVEPRTADETTLVQIWCQLLQRKSVSIHENFFQLGGHSLLATQVIWRIAGAFKVDLPVRAIFESPTVAELAKMISQAPACAPEICAIAGDRTSNPWSLSPAAQLDELMKDSTAPEVSA